MNLYLQSTGPLGPNSTYSLYAKAYTERDCDRLIQHLRLVRDWLEQDQYAADRRDQWRHISAG